MNDIYIYEVSFGPLRLKCEIEILGEDDLYSQEVMGRVVEIHEQNGFGFVKEGMCQNFEKQFITCIRNPNNIIKEIV